jgi:queuine tRNA-ribosyltransferase catalytic subunit
MVRSQVPLSYLELTNYSAVTQHNIAFQAQLMGKARDAIVAGSYPDYLRTFFKNYFGESGYPKWCVDALRSVNVDILEDGTKVIQGNGVKWEYATR